MPQATERPAKVRGVALALLFAALAVATPACEPLDAPEAGLGDANATRDAAPAADVSQDPDQTADISISPETSTDSDADGDRSRDGGSTNDGTDIQGADATADTTDGADDTTRDAEIEDGAPDSPADAGIDGSDGSSLDADAGTGIADAVAPDGDDADGNLTPIFPTCTYVASVGFTPAVIIDAASDLGRSYPPGCSCAAVTHAYRYRILCGWFSAQSALVYTACPAPGDVPGGQREIMTLPQQQVGPGCGTDAGAFSHVARPLSDWDLLLNEQIAGHADSGGHD